MGKIEHPFVPFAPDNTVCDTCGKLGEDHTSAVLLQYRDDIWKFLLKHGYIHSYYGGQRDAEMDQVRIHMRHCSVNHDYSQEPRAGKVEEFTDTESDSAQVDKFFGLLYCKCGEISYYEICIDMTMGQIIWHVVKGV